MVDNLEDFPLVFTNPTGGGGNDYSNIQPSMRNPNPFNWYDNEEEEGGISIIGACQNIHQVEAELTCH